MPIMPIDSQIKGVRRTVVADMFSLRSEHISVEHGTTVIVNPEPVGQECLDMGKVVPVFEARIVDGSKHGWIIQVAEEELDCKLSRPSSPSETYYGHTRLDTGGQS